MNTDIDDRKNEEARLSMLRNLYVALSEPNQSIIQSRNRNALFNEVCRIAVENGQFAAAWIDLPTLNNEFLERGAAYGIDTEAWQALVTRIGNFEHECGVTERAIRENQPVVRSNVCVSFDRQSCAEMSRHGSIACIPIRRAGHPFGALSMCSTQRNFFDAASIDVLQQVSNDISYAVDMLEGESQHRGIEANLASSEKFNSAILTAALDCIVSINQHGEIISFNHASELTFGYRSADILGKKLAETLIPPEWRERHQKGIAHLLATGKSNILNRRVELSAMRADGAIFPIEMAIVPLRLQNRLIFTAFIRDIRERKQAEMLQLGQNRILNMVATGGPLAKVLSEVTRFAESQFDNAICTIRLANDDRIASSDPVPSNVPKSGHDTAIMHGTQISLPIVGNGKKTLGTFILHFCEGVTQRSKEQEISKICINLAGIAIERRAAEERIRYLAHYDELTALPNRFLFKEYLELALRNAKRHRKKFAALFLDLDKFKAINDSLGHDAGDQVLREIATRLRDSLRQTDKIARMGGDEFYVLIEDLDEGRRAADVAQKLLDEAARPVRIGDEDYKLSVSIGIAIYPDDGNDGQELLKNADIAMYRAKELGKNGFRFYASSYGSEECGKLIVFDHSPLLHRHSKKTMSLT